MLRIYAWLQEATLSGWLRVRVRQSARACLLYACRTALTSIPEEQRRAPYEGQESIPRNQSNCMFPVLGLDQPLVALAYSLLHFFSLRDSFCLQTEFWLEEITRLIRLSPWRPLQVLLATYYYLFTISLACCFSGFPFSPLAPVWKSRLACASCHISLSATAISINLVV